jgi:hypothetical protein
MLNQLSNFWKWASPISGTLVALTGVVITSSATLAAKVPVFDHIVIVIEENHAYSQIIGSSAAPYINSLASQGAVFTNSHGVTHPSQPNYIALFSGSQQGLTVDNCPQTFNVSNLGSQLSGIGRSFTGYSETLPSVGYTGCFDSTNVYVRRHAPWVAFPNIPASSNQPFSAFPTSFAKLSTVSIIDPNLNDDMHNGTIQQADTWLENNLDSYAQWAKTHNSLLIITFDEDDDTAANQIPTIFVGAHVKSGQYSETINHYNILRTIEASYGLPGLGNAATLSPITDVWQ